MPRLPRLLLSQSYYHVMTRGNNKNIIFRSAKDYKKYLGIFHKLKHEHPFDLYHFCLMPNHVHLLVKTNKASDFSTFMKRLNLKYFYYYKKKYGWVGHFFQDRFKSQPVGKDEYFIQCGKYIELNPVRAGLVKNPKDYLYSSYNFYSYGEKNDLITADFVYENLTETEIEKRKKYQKLIVDITVLSNYKKRIWGSSGQRYNETRKIRYHRK
ncbi:MAG: hypothetical protein US75_C0003G0027 [Candidatus Woesebacteria bacterium GW2011_GWC1_38_13]|uniref:Transposase IS200-like domain-containing protein n=2 Tax=Candidatus Woeseibacteriota TaxID=1752722 RepID=A0A0G0KYE8_9BACT|nr:MAG: hypothetical protein US75_C0003G0027 [Candidatus Woesebacteria bacterium GW2011_GWC1_38_13]KKQ83757.1 MAG: hypothetical protein UT06_C0017G0033 [Candidatus Woesebacteria bacterium GW2011_GWA1_38_8]